MRCQSMESKCSAKLVKIAVLRDEDLFVVFSTHSSLQIWQKLCFFSSKCRFRLVFIAISKESPPPYNHHKILPMPPFPNALKALEKWLSIIVAWWNLCSKDTVKVMQELQAFRRNKDIPPPTSRFTLPLAKLLHCLLSKHHYCYICDSCNFCSKPEKV